MTIQAPARLDDTSRRVIARFALRVVFSIVLAFALRGELNYAAAAAAAVAVWLAFYAVLAMGVGLLTRETLAARSFNYLDEAMWLVLSAWLMRTISHLVA